jgi:hypothetical protein
MLRRCGMCISPVRAAQQGGEGGMQMDASSHARRCVAHTQTRLGTVIGHGRMVTWGGRAPAFDAFEKAGWACLKAAPAPAGSKPAASAPWPGGEGRRPHCVRGWCLEVGSSALAWAGPSACGCGRQRVPLLDGHPHAVLHGQGCAARGAWCVEIGSSSWCAVGGEGDARVHSCEVDAGAGQKSASGHPPLGP